MITKLGGQFNRRFMLDALTLTALFTVLYNIDVFGADTTDADTTDDDQLVHNENGEITNDWQQVNHALTEPFQFIEFIVSHYINIERIIQVDPIDAVKTINEMYAPDPKQCNIMKKYMKTKTDDSRIKYLKYGNAESISLEQIFYKKYLLYDSQLAENPSLNIYQDKYLKYKNKYLALKKQLEKK
jgi:hypothetical protein